MQYFKQSIESNLCLLKYKVIFALIGLFLTYTSTFFQSECNICNIISPSPKVFLIADFWGLGWPWVASPDWVWTLLLMLFLNQIKSNNPINTDKWCKVINNWLILIGTWFLWHDFFDIQLACFATLLINQLVAAHIFFANTQNTKLSFQLFFCPFSITFLSLIALIPSGIWSYRVCCGHHCHCLAAAEASPLPSGTPPPTSAHRRCLFSSK